MANRKVSTQYILAILTSIIAAALNYIITLILTPYITENIGTEAYGFVSLAKTFANYASIFTVALNSFASRYISVEYHKGNFQKANIYFNSVFRANIILGVAIFGGASAIIWHIQMFLSIPESLQTDVKLLFLLDTLNFVILSCSTVFMSTTVIQNRLELSGIAKCIAYTAEGVFLFIAYSIWPAKVFYIGIGLIVSSLCIWILNILINKRHTPQLKIQKNHYSGEAIRQLVGNGIWNSVNALGNTLNTGLDLAVSNIMLSALRAGQVAIVKTIGTIVSTLFQLTAQPFQPLQLRYYAEGEKSKLINSFNVAIKINGMLSNIAFAGFTVFGSIYYTLWVPSQDVDLLQRVSIVVMLCSIIEGAVYPLYYVYTLTLKNKVPCYVTIASGLCNIIGMYLLIKCCNADIYAVVGTTAVLSWVVNFVFNPIYAAKCLKAEKWAFYPTLLRHLISCVVMTTSFYGIYRVFTPSTWMELILAAVLCTVVGILIHIAVMINREECHKVLALLSNRKK